MKHRDRVLTALNHETPDRCPMQVSFTPEFADRLRADLDIQGRKVHNPLPKQDTLARTRVNAKTQSRQDVLSLASLRPCAFALRKDCYGGPEN